MNKKTIIKKCIGKGGCGKGGIIGATIREIPGTVAGMGKNLKKAIDPGDVTGLVKKGIKGVVNSLVAPTIRYNKFLKERDEKWREEGEDLMKGREKYVPSITQTPKQAILKGIMRKVAPLPKRAPVPERLKPIPLPKPLKTIPKMPGIKKRVTV